MLARRLLNWYDRHGRALPWRAAPGERPDPYGVWLSEVMLQQTTVAAVKGYYERFLALWPTVEALAAADLDDVLGRWAGLGYYARARNLHACAKVVATEMGGRFPDDEGGLRALPGVGGYTAAAIAAIAFDRRAVVVDGNVERVMARRHAVEEPLPGVKPRLKALADALTPIERCGDYAQAVMDLGATVCTPRAPACGRCPWAEGCLARERGIAETLPRRAAKAVRPTRHGVAFWIVNSKGEALLRKRPETGLLGGMLEIPSTDWRAAPWAEAEAAQAAPAPGAWRFLAAPVVHVFTHFRLEMVVAVRDGGPTDGLAGRWARPDDFSALALPSAMRKVAARALKG